MIAHAYVPHPVWKRDQCEFKYDDDGRAGFCGKPRSEHMRQPKPPDCLTLDAISAEVMRARRKFPGNRFLLAALMEEVGELARALLQRKPGDEIEKEAIQVACVAVRIIEERDATFEDVKDHEALP